ncbi:hypothetical protein BU23DRAFT_285663 [Bimuria novae-zelandiae CBS 107.79]|uniref:Zn(2)-C6 fungal-type domain-containing protein n=1 Tax=Bimuria novae-zelandiae CBS 107.79 TaxID=1447943 RepID=A0A6A5UR25_9PLEO|nr:hypothetical protein BU23DRAFT_285663 [Bimuria novae-zelandiae CBS 107.79]
MPKLRETRRASRACEGCRVKKKRCTARSSSGNLSPCCDECKSLGQVCIFTPRRLNTSDAVAIAERASLVNGLEDLFALTREHGCSPETAAQREANPIPELNYILRLLKTLKKDKLEYSGQGAPPDVSPPNINFSRSSKGRYPSIFRQNTTQMPS